MTQHSKNYYAVIFTSTKKDSDPAYDRMSQAMMALAQKQKGFISYESARSSEGFGITISYWETSDDIRAWHQNTSHQAAQEKGKQSWYESYKVRICKVEREYSLGV